MLGNVINRRVEGRNVRDVFVKKNGSEEYWKIFERLDVKLLVPLILFATLKMA